MNDDELRVAFEERAGRGLESAPEYRRKVQTMILQRERAVRRASFASGLGYIVALLVSIVLMIAAGVWFEGQLKGVWLGVTACYWLVFASVLVFNRALARNHLDTLKELKGIEMRLLELQERLERG